MYIAAALVVLALVAIWFFSDKVVYRGTATVMANAMKHYSKTHKTVFVMPHGSFGDKAPSLVATVSNAKAASIAASNFGSRQVTVRKRFLGQPRVTSVS